MVQNQVNLTPNTPSADVVAYVVGDSVKGKIAFNTNRDGNFEIYAMDISGANVSGSRTTPARQRPHMVS